MRKIILFASLFCFLWQTSFAQYPYSDVFLNQAIQKRDTLLVDALNLKAFNHKSNHPDSALFYVKKAQNLAQNLRYRRGVADAFHTMGLINWYKGKYEETLPNFYEAKKIRENIGDKIGMGRTYNNIGLVFQELGDNQEALDFFRRSLQIRKEIGDTIGIAYAYNNIGEVYQTEGSFSAAHATYNRALNLVQQKGDTKGISFILTNQAELFWKTGQPQKALAIHHKALAIRKGLHDKNGMAENMNRLASIYIHHGEVNKALELLHKSLVLGKEASALLRIQDTYRLMAKVHAEKRNYKQAYDFQVAYQQLHDSVFNQRQTQAIAAIQSKQEMADMENQIMVLEQYRKISNLQFYVMTVIIIGFILLGAFAFVWIRYKLESKTTNLLTRQKQEIEAKNEELARSNQQLEEFTHAVSHDLKEPLRTVGSYSTLLARRYGSTLDQEGQIFIGFITQGVSHMHALLSDLLSYAGIGKNGLSTKEVDMNVIFSKVLFSLEAQINEKLARIIVSNMPVIQAIPSGMYQLFQNLISNAIKFSSGQDPEVIVSSESRDDGYLFTVEDNGIGIDPTYKNRIFQAFQRLNGKQDFPGTGIGLAICKKIVQQHNGKIWVESEEGEGSTFYVFIPNGSER